MRIGAGIPLPQQPAAPILTQPATRGTSLTLLNPNLRTGYVHQYSLNIQRELLRNTVVDIGYVGTRGVKLFMDRNLNQPRIYGDFLQAFREIQAFQVNGAPVSAGNTLVRIFGSPTNAMSRIGATSFQQGLVNPAADALDRNNFQSYGAAGVPDFYLRNFPQFNLVTYGTNDGRSYYDSLQASVRRQAGALRMNLNYTFSKSIDNVSADGNGFSATALNVPIDSFNLKLNRARGDFDRPHSFNASFIYTLPIGRNHWLAGNAPRWVDTLIGGWDVGSLMVWQSGATFTVVSGRQTAATTVSTWANYTGDRKIGSVMRKGNGVFFFTPEEIARFSYPAAGEIGNSGRNAFRGPRYFNTDMSLVKHFKISERHQVTFRAEAYNLPNHVNFQFPGGSSNTLALNYPGANLVNSASFGKIGQTLANNPRIFQMALRYDF